MGYWTHPPRAFLPPHYYGSPLGAPSEPPDQPLPSSDSESALTPAQIAPFRGFGDHIPGRSWARA
eukprot:10602242-Alexandrium_andersonii.AAC.1